MIQALTCPKCGGSLSRKAENCPYCGVALSGHEIGSINNSKLPAEDFKPRSKTLFITGLVGAVMIYFGGWRYENIHYWLDDRAIILWAGVLPLWLAFLAFIWCDKSSSWKLGFIPALLLFVVHLGIMWFYRGYINDDSIGIAAMFAGASLAGWIVGYIVRHLVTRYRAQA